MKKLFEKESVNFNTKSIKDEHAAKEEAINEKYRKGEVRIITEQARYPLNTILGIVKSDDYILNPEFQRRHRWDVLKKSKLIESIIMNVPIPPVFLYEISYSVYEVMDGLQRLTAIAQFYSDEYKLEGLEEWSELNGYSYSTLPEQVRKGIDRRYISSIILLQETAKNETEAKRLKQLVFERINSGGAMLTYQESRNAIYPGGLNNLCIKLARNEKFCRMWSIPEPSAAEKAGQVLPEELIKDSMFSKMEDVELVLRFFAFRQIDKWDNDQLKSFLDDYLKLGNLFPADVLSNLEKAFVETIDLIYDIFGEAAFWLPRERTRGGEPKWTIYEQPTKVLYDSLMYVLSDFTAHKELLTSKAEQIRKELDLVYKEQASQFKGRFNKNDITKRMELLEKYFEAIIK
ncbi:MAG TPA: DUF262 domain-containing protein [Paludibacter sp.]|nr:DUF262 domain-containing protein [Paludibacter sp.]